MRIGTVSYMPYSRLSLMAILALSFSAAPFAGPEGVFPSCIEPLTPEARKQFCTEWDALLRTDVLACGETLLPRVLVNCADTPYGDVHVLRYGNEEIRRRVLALFIAEYQYRLSMSVESAVKAEQTGATEEQKRLWLRNREREQRLLAQSIDTHGNLFTPLAMNPEGRTKGEREMDYLDLLATAAESTFAAEIYAEVWGFPASGELRVGYLVESDPARTLQELLGSEAGFTLDGKEYAGEVLFTGGGFSLFICTAFEVVQRICERHPALAGNQAHDIRRFAHAHALYFGPKGKPAYREIDDFMLRQAALQILSLLGNDDDIPFVQELAKNPPEKRPPAFRRDLQNKASIAEQAASAIRMIGAR